MYTHGSKIVTAVVHDPPRRMNVTLRDIACQHSQPDRPWLEFGVWTGHTLGWVGMWTKNQVYGFDTFTGLPEDWLNPEGTVHHPKGYFAYDEVASDFSHNVHTVVGRFQDTLSVWLKTHGGHLAMSCSVGITEPTGAPTNRVAPHRM